MKADQQGKKPFIGLVLAMAPTYSETFLKAKIEGLRQAGFDVRVFVALRIEKTHALRATAAVLRAWILLMLFRPQRVVRFVVSERALGRKPLKIAHSLAAYYPILMRARPGWLHFGFAAVAVGGESLASSVGSRMGLSLRGYDIVTYPLKHPGCYSAVWSKVQKVHTISDDLAAAARFHGMPASTPVTKITPAIDPGFFRLDCPRAERTSECRILTVARLHWKKGLEYTLIALRSVVEEAPEIRWKFTIAGDGPELERLAFASAEMGLEDRVTFAGKLGPEAIKDLYAEADVYVHYSVQEGFCNAALEAQAMELPCIVSDAEGLAENVGDDGVVVPRRQPRLLADALHRFARMPFADRLKWGRAARRRVIAEFGLERQHRAFAKFFDVS